MPLTPYQELAVQSRGGARLVSAAAGSGKTKVLVERLMRYVDDGADIDGFLVVTYTRAAAGELRSRILSALNERIAADPMNRRLRRQTELVCRAGIGTIDSLCGRFLRENTHLAGIAPDFKVAEPDRAETIRAGAMERVMDALYVSLAEDEGMRALVDSFGAGRNDRRLSELVLGLHAAVQSHPDPAAWLQKQTDALHAPAGTDAGETAWGKYLLSRTADLAEYWAGRMESLLSDMASPGHEKLRESYGDTLSATAEGLRALARAAAMGWEKVRENLPVEFPKPAKGFRGEDPLLETMKAAREECKKSIKGQESVFAESSAELLSELERGAPAMEALLRLTAALDRAYAAEKKRQGVVDFSDQEHMMLRLLEDERNGLAAALSARFTEVLVDEYQDVNACQDRLFYHLSDHARKLFLVGDVKQSIYRFRLADPTIFLDKYNRWPDVTPQLPAGEPGRILLRENFRSRHGVLEAANHIFRNIMSPSLGNLRYDEAAALRPGRELPPGGGAPIEMTVLSLPEGEEDDRPDKTALEAEYVAGQIRALVDGGALVTEGDTLRRADWGDFAILLRSHKNAAARYRSALESRGIPAVAQQGGGFFRSLEVTVLLSLLSVIDNPRQDVPLIAALRSPVFGFTADDLAAVRARDRDGDFYTALTLAAGENEKYAAFLRELEGYRQLAADLSVETLLGRICDRTELFALLSAMPDGAARRENVQLLMDYARQFELDGYRGVFPFVAWMRRLEQRGEEPRTGTAELRRAVQIISIHHSKGLEYPIVFLAGTGKKFNKRDAAAPVLIHPELGVGGKVVDTARGIQYPTLAHRAIAARISEETLSEEMRVLYVAMTRARDRLYISCLLDDGEKRVQKLREGLTAPISPELLRSDAAPAGWLIRAALLPDSPVKLTLRTAGETPETEEPLPEAGTAPVPETASPAEAAVSLDWVYPMAWAAELPSKITASALEGSEADPDARDVSPAAKRRAPARRPELGGPDRPLTPTERGVAVHTVMQFMDFAKGGTPEGVRGEIRRLLSRGHLTPAQAKAAGAEAEKICAFFRSPTGKRVLGADRVWRELRFSLLTGAEDFFPVPAGEEMLLQGVVDCCIREGETLTVIDYKTDYVTQETLGDKAAEYAPQIRAYAAALQRVLGLPVREGVLFFLRTGESVSVPLD